MSRDLSRFEKRDQRAAASVTTMEIPLRATSPRVRSSSTREVTNGDRARWIAW